MGVLQYEIKEEATLVGGVETQNALVSYAHMVDKNWEGYIRGKESQPHCKLPSPGFQCQKDKSP